MSSLLFAAVSLCLAAVAGGAVYYGLVIVAARRFRRQPQAYLAPAELPAISVLKPLAGLDLGLEENLRSFFRIDYPRYELLFAVGEESDPAAPLIRRLQQEYPDIETSLMVTGSPDSPATFPNAKVYSLLQMSKLARYPILVISDSDIRADRNYLRGIAADFADPRVGVSTCPYRAVPGGSFWSLLEALGMNTEFWSGVLVAWMLEGMNFAVGPTMAIRRSCLESLGGFERVRDYLAEDFVLGRLGHELGFRVVLSHHVVEHHIGSQPFGENFRHRLRWYRSTRRSRPSGYVAQVFTYPLPIAALLVVLGQGVFWAWMLFAGCTLLRFLAMAAVAPRVLHDRLAIRYAWLVPLQDLASFAIWCLAFFGNTIVWRGRRFRLLPDGRLRLLS